MCATPEHATWTTIGAFGQSSWSTLPRLRSGVSDFNKAVTLTCTPQTADGYGIKVELKNGAMLQATHVYDGTAQSDQFWGPNGTNTSTYVDVVVANMTPLRASTSLVIEAKVVDIQGKITSTYGPTTAIGTPGKACYVDVEQVVELNINNGDTATAPITRSNELTMGTLSLSITPSSVSGNFGALINVANADASLNYKVEGVTLESGAYVTNNANNSVNVYVPANTVSGKYSGSANVVVSCQ